MLLKSPLLHRRILNRKRIAILQSQRAKYDVEMTEAVEPEGAVVVAAAVAAAAVSAAEGSEGTYLLKEEQEW